MFDLKSVQYLRAVAALMIVVYHLAVPLGRMGYAGPWPHWLAAGVDVFFVISGFIMWITTSAGHVSPRTFYYRRIVRIVPLYWIMTTVVVGVLLFYPAAMQTAKFDLHNILASYAFLPSVNPGTGLMEPVLVPGWTLNYEMFFYLLFGAALLLPVPARLAAMVGVLAGLGLYGAWAEPGSPVVAFYTSGIILEFAFGILVGWVFQRGLAAPAPVGWGLLVLGTAAIPLATAIGPDLPRVLIWGVPATAILVGALLLERRAAVPDIAVLRLLGDASYSIYLSHGIALAVVWRLWAMLGLAALPALFAMAAMILAAAAGIFVYLVLERPIVGLTKRRRRQAAPVGRPQAV